MTVTELALLHLTPSPSALSHLRAALAVQDKWHAKTYPHLPTSFPGSICFQSVSDPAEILITARWQSVAAHWAWIKSDDNAGVMDTLGPFISKEGNEDFSLLHVEGDVFGGVVGEGVVGLLESPVVAVCRVEVKGGRKEGGGVVEGWKRYLTATAAPHVVRGGWREDVESEERQEYVVVSGWKTKEEAWEAEQAGQFMEASGRVSLKSTHYKRML